MSDAKALRTLVIVLAIGLMTLLTNRATALLFDNSYLHGIDTLIVVGGVGGAGPNHTLFPHRQYSSFKNMPPSAILLTVKEIFSQTPWIAVKARQEVPLKESCGSNIMYLSFQASAQEDLIGGKPVKVGALALQLERPSAGCLRSAVPTPPVTYPFMIPDTPDELDKKLVEGVHLLADYLPSYFECSNKYSYPSEQCPDCSLDSCRPQNPYQQTRKAKP